MTDVTGWHLDQVGQLTCSTPTELAQVPLEERRPPTDPAAYHGRQGIITRWWSATNRSSVICGSLRRTRVAIELDSDQDVVRFSGEPLELHWQTDTTKHRWRPDFMARTTSGHRAVVVVRPDKPGPQWRMRLSVLHEVAQQADWRLQERTVPWGVRRANLEWASGYRHPFLACDGEEHALLTAFDRPRPVLEGVMASGLPRLSGLDLAWRLVWRQRLLVDWDVPLLPTSTAWAAGTGR